MAVAESQAALRIRAISFDLDDTLWPIEPAIARAEIRLDDWLKTHAPTVAAAWPISAMRGLRDRISAEYPHLSHDFTAQRKLSLRAALEPHGFGDEDIEAAFEAYYAARNEVEVYADTLPALRRLAARWPLLSLTNGNADLERIGLRDMFAHTVSARDVGIAKPDIGIFHHACARLGVAPGEVLHVGDDPVLDIVGARAAGLRTVWLNRRDAVWNHGAPPDLIVSDLGTLADWLELSEAIVAETSA
jgi:putative hydrolase of the HAD superfamily